MSLGNHASEALRSAIHQIETELGSDCDRIGQVDALFTWQGQSYRVSLQPYVEEVPGQEKATKGSHQNVPMPKKRAELRLARRFDADEYELMKLGFIPMEMEDKWFIYFDGRRKEFRFHRSWTGFCIYIVKIVADRNGGCHIAAAWVNNDPEQYGGEPETSKEEAMVAWLIDYFLLQRRDAPFPSSY
jgi:hypothetical protein